MKPINFKNINDFAKVETTQNAIVVVSNDSCTIPLPLRVAFPCTNFSAKDVPLTKTTKSESLLYI
jgi:hypothetical protein